MPCKTKTDLPESAKNVLPSYAQEIYRKRLTVRGSSTTSRKSAVVTAHRVARSAVKNKYEKNQATGKWKEK